MCTTVLETACTHITLMMVGSRWIDFLKDFLYQAILREFTASLAKAFGLSIICTEEENSGRYIKKNLKEMKYIKLFEDFINEGEKVLDKELAQAILDTLKAKENSFAE